MCSDRLSLGGRSALLTCLGCCSDFVEYVSPCPPTVSFLVVAVIGDTYRGYVGGYLIIDRHRSRLLNSLKMFVIVKG